MSSEFQTALRARALRPRPATDQGGRGIVTCAGGARLFISAYVLVRVLRETLACPLPIQLWHFGGEELSPAMRRLLEAQDVELVDANAALDCHPADIRDGWQLKPYAILHSRFQEVLFLDADQVPAVNPARLFDWPEYREAGAVFWPDIIDIRADNPIWALVGLPGESQRSWESGQILVDKRRHWAALQMTLFLNERADITYRMVYGDKDTFLVAWRVAGAAAAVAPHRPFTDSHMLVQRDFGGAPLFQHRTNAKWTYHGDQRQLDGFVHMEACLRFLEDLRRAWNGGVFFPPDRSLAARDEEARLERLKRLRLTIVADREIELELLPGHQLGLGRSADRQNWYVTDAQEGLTLILHDGDRATYRIASAQKGVWLGERLALPANAVRLDEAPSAEPAVASGTGGLIADFVDASGFHADVDESVRRELVGTLRLLLRAQPGARASLEALGRGSPALGALAREALAANGERKPHPIEPDIATVQDGYDAPGDRRL